MNTLILGTGDNQIDPLTLAIVREAQNIFSAARQMRYDLIARMSTEWPAWGCSLDFFTHVVLPIYENPFLLHFINLSDGFGIDNTFIEFGYVDDDNIKYVFPYYDNKGNPEYLDLTDLAIYLLRRAGDKNIVKSNWNGLSLKIDRGDYPKKWAIDFENRAPLPVRLRDGAIGAQAFNVILEGIMRNAAKHGIKDSYWPAKLKNKQPNKDVGNFVVKIIFCDEREQVGKFVEFPQNFAAKDDAIEKELKSRRNFIIISVNRDLMCEKDEQERKLKVKINNKDEEMPLLDKGLSEILKIDTVIDSSGKLTEFGWGFKEMKICAAFLANEKLDVVSSGVSPDYIMVGRSKNKLWSDAEECHQERLCYVLRVEKPKYAIIVAPESKKDYEWQGVKFVESLDELDELKDEDLDYDFLYIDGSLTEDKKRAEKEWFKYPARRIMNTNGVIKSFGRRDGLLLEFYKKHLRENIFGSLGLKGDNQVGLSIFWENLAVAESWEKEVASDFRNFVQLEFPVKVNARKGDANALDAYIWRHIPLSDKRVPVQKYYYQYATYSDLFFSFLMSINPDRDKFLASYTLMQVIESVLCNVLIIDERIAKAVSTRKAPDEQGISLAEKLYWMGIYVAGKVVKVNNGKKEPIWSLSEPDPRLVVVKFGSDGTLKSVEFSNDVQNQRACNINSPACKLKTPETFPFHVISIHATRSNEICERLNCSEDKLIEKMKDKVDRVVVHSGRGKTEGDIPEKVPFLEYSLLDRYLIQEPSKFYLVQTLMSAIEGV
ncbi:MAG: hypothetical protein ACTSW4_06160 [Candidatus Ranarchaeia archaeon]